MSCFECYLSIWWNQSSDVFSCLIVGAFRPNNLSGQLSYRLSVDRVLANILRRKVKANGESYKYRWGYFGILNWQPSTVSLLGKLGIPDEYAEIPCLHSPEVRLFACDVKVYTLRHTANKKNCPWGFKNVKVYPLAPVNKNFKTSTTCLDTLYTTTFRSDTSDGQRSSR